LILATSLLFSGEICRSTLRTVTFLPYLLGSALSVVFIA